MALSTHENHVQLVTVKAIHLLGYCEDMSGRTKTVYSYRENAYVEVPVPVPKRESPLVRLGLLALVFGGPGALAYAGNEAVVALPGPTWWFIVLGVWALGAYLAMFLEGREIVPGSRLWDRRHRMVARAWAPVYIPGLIAWKVGRWVVRGEDDA